MRQFDEGPDYDPDYKDPVPSGPLICATLIAILFVAVMCLLGGAPT